MLALRYFCCNSFNFHNLMITHACLQITTPTQSFAGNFTAYQDHQKVRRELNRKDYTDIKIPSVPKTAYSTKTLNSSLHFSNDRFLNHIADLTVSKRPGTSFQIVIHFTVFSRFYLSFSSLKLV